MMIPTLTELTRHRAQSKRERSRRRAEAMLRHPSAGLDISHAPELEVAEGVLQRQLVDGDIDPASYRAEMRRLAVLAR